MRFRLSGLSCIGFKCFRGFLRGFNPRPAGPFDVLSPTPHLCSEDHLSGLVRTPFELWKIP